MTGTRYVSMASWSSSSPDLYTILVGATSVVTFIKPDSAITGSATNYAKVKFFEVTPSNVVVQKLAEIDFTAGTNAPAGVSTVVPDESVVPISPGNRIRGIVVQVGSGMTLPDGYVQWDFYN